MVVSVTLGLAKDSILLFLKMAIHMAPFQDVSSSLVPLVWSLIALGGGVETWVLPYQRVTPRWSLQRDIFYKAAIDHPLQTAYLVLLPCILVCFICGLRKVMNRVNGPYYS